MALIGDRERERAVELLKTHYQRGRLSMDELAERIEVALTARRERDVRVALAELPAAPGRRSPLQSALTGMWRAVGRAAFVLAVWCLWWATSLSLLIGFVVSIDSQGVSLKNTVAFAALWLVVTVLARCVTRRPRPAGG
jgi:DUF1707 SHOCT-like domain